MTISHPGPLCTADISPELLESVSIQLGPGTPMEPQTDSCSEWSTEKRATADGVYEENRQRGVYKNIHIVDTEKRKKTICIH